MPAKPHRHVVQVIAPAAFGGAETVVRSLSEELMRAGVGVTVIPLTPSSAVHPWTDSLIERGIAVRPIAVGSRGYRNEISQLRAILGELRPMAVHSHGYRADVSTLFAARDVAPWVSTVHGFTDIGARANVYQWIDRLALTRAGRVIVVADHIVSQLTPWGVSRNRIEVIRNAFRPSPCQSREDARLVLGIPDDANVIGWVGRLSREKGPDLLLDVLRKIHEPLEVAVIGDGPERDGLENEARALPKNISVRMFGRRADAASLMRAFDILVLTSRSEGMPLVVLESMAAGTPVVSFNVGDVSRAVTSDTGWTVTPANVDEFASTLQTALVDSAARRAKQEAGIAHVSREFSADGWVQAHLACYAAAGR